MAKRSMAKRSMATSSRVPAHRTYTPELFANARARYEQTAEPVAVIAADLGIHRESMRRLARNHNWIRGNMPPARDLSPAMRLLAAAQAMEAGLSPPPVESLPAPPASTSPPLAPLVGGGEKAPAEPSAIERVERAVLAELATVEAMRAELGTVPQRWTDAERTARTLGLLTQTLQHLQRLRAGRAPESRSYDDENNDDDLPRDIDEFRRDLARRIDAFVASRTEPRGADGDCEPATLDAAR
jgi:hypothetical protein